MQQQQQQHHELDWVDVKNEKCRCYTFYCTEESIKIEGVRQMAIDSDGCHHLVDKEGVHHCVKGTWIHMCIHFSEPLVS